jgi:hypothetical protein
VNTTARTDITTASWPLCVSDTGHRNLIRVTARGWPGTALRPGRLVAEAVMATASGQRPADANTLSAGHDTVAGHTTSRPWSR